MLIKKNYSDNAIGNVLLTVENLWYFKFLWVQGALSSRTCFLGRKTKLINRFLYKKNLYSDGNVNQLRKLAREKVRKKVFIK